jgi:hypothetical protein
LAPSHYGNLVALWPSIVHGLVCQNICSRRKPIPQHTWRRLGKWCNNHYTVKHDCLHVVIIVTEWTNLHTKSFMNPFHPSFHLIIEVLSNNNVLNVSMSA